MEDTNPADNTPTPLVQAMIFLADLARKANKEKEMNNETLVDTPKQQPEKVKPPRKQFTQEDDTYIRENYGKVPLRVICDHLSITTYKLYSRAEQLGLGGRLKDIKKSGGGEDTVEVVEDADGTEDTEDTGTHIKIDIAEYPDFRQRYALCIGAGRDFGRAQKMLLESMVEYAKEGYVAQGGISHTIQTFEDESLLHYILQAMVREVDRTEVEVEK